jgi:diguanylate cyclase (GGDEF)-like protein
VQAPPNLDAVRSDPARLAALDALDALDTPPEQQFHRLTELITLIFGVDIGIVSLMDAHRQWYKGVVGLPNTEVDLRSSFCQYPLVSGEPLIIEDASKDVRFADHPSVAAGPKIRFYAGIPLKTTDGHVVGSLCAIDKRARSFGERETMILSHLASSVMSEFNLRLLAGTDSLTGAMSRRAFKEDCTKHLALAKRHASPVSCVVFDIDHFKHINDTYGHAAGDKVLRQLVDHGGNLLRESDLFGRIGGEEFAILLPQTEETMATAVAEKLRLSLRELQFPGSQPPMKVTASFGVASLSPGDDIDNLLHKADQALYDAKRTGRNRTCRWQPTEAEKRVNRRRVLKAGQIIFNKRTATMDCTVRSLWDQGAELLVSNTMDVPEQFGLAIRGSNKEERCTIVYRGPSSLDVAFV